MSYTTVGSAQPLTSGGGTSALHITFNATAIGDVLVVMSSPNKVVGVTSLSYSGVTTWTQLVGFNAGTVACDIHWGVITATGSASIQVNLTGNSGAVATACAQQFHSSVSGTWTADTNTATGAAGGTSGNVASVTPIAAGELYLGALGQATAGTSLTTSTSGYTIIPGSQASALYYDLSAPGTANSPNYTATGNSVSMASMAGFLYVPASYVPSQRVTRQAIPRASYF